MVDFVLRRAARFLCFACVVLIGLLPLLPRSVGAQDDIGDSISSQRYIVIDAATGEVFAEKGAHDEVAIASLTKVFTTIEAIERAPLTTEITTDESDLFDSSSTTMGFGPGETFTLNDLLYGMMLPSGNDAAHAIARALGAENGDTPEESVQRFVGYMNERIRNMGLTETTLVNPHGLGVPGHHSSAHDLATFTMYALKYPTFVDVISTSEYNANGYLVANTNRMLGSYDGLIGGKTGYDEDSGYCLIEVAQRNGDTMISVTLDGVAPDVWYQDNAILLDYAFEQKAGRVAADQPISGEVLSYRDPDAAVIAQMVTPGASLGQEEADAPTPTAAVPGSDATPVPAAQIEPGGGGTDWSGGVALIVAAIVLIVSVVFRLSGSTLKRPPGRQPSSPPSTPDDPAES
jgi:D-alanyl-D-alanine carboxypeptidase (penicillin-binding protein 5/6)